MHILVVPSFYPDSDNENLGIFFKEQVYALADNSNKVGVVYVEMRSVKNFSWKQLRNSFFQFECNTENLWIEYRIKGWRIPSFVGRQFWLYLTRKLIDKYILLNGRPDVIHAHNSFYAGIAANDAYVKKHIKYVITEHDSDFLEGNFTKKKKSLIAKVYSDSLQVISVSKALKRAMNSISPHVNILVIPNIVNTDYFIPKEEGAAPAALTFLAIGNLTENKNHKLIINAFFNISQLYDNTRLVICGEGPEKQNLLNLVKKYNLEDKVEVKGFLRKDKILHELQNSSCLVHASNYETFGVVLIEALSCGLPVVSTKSGGPDDIFVKGMGYLISINNLEELVKALLHFIENQNGFDKYYLRDIALNNYSRLSVYKRIYDCYR
tara:strand:- start:127 stop:1266 length:1140 start_codon:yes stop_codon:yes gene_type:complete